MIDYFEGRTGGYYTADISDGFALVPDAMDAKAWFAFKGQWANRGKCW